MKSPYEQLFELGFIDEETLFSALFSHQALLEEFKLRFAKTPSKGVDRLNGAQFSSNAAEILENVSRKCGQGRFRFSPYLESLKSKGRDKKPRLISMPTIRDRVVLRQLNKFLASVWPDRVPKNVAHTFVRRACERFSSATRGTWICKTDIQTFYDGVVHETILDVLGEKLGSSAALALTTSAIRTPTVEKHSKRSSRLYVPASIGVPQGLAISNILASIYLEKLDTAMHALPVNYFRYVDDILIIGKKRDVSKAFGVLRGLLKPLGLSVHSKKSSKTQIQQYSQPFEYLGYVFNWPRITVRESTVERFLQSIAAMFSAYRHGRKRKLARLKFLTEDRLKEIFLLELNEKIAGAISEKRRYGWIAYFNLITDLSLLHRMDAAIAGMFGRLSDFQSAPKGTLKRLARAYFEMRFNPTGGYVHNFDSYSSTAKMLQFLVERALVDPNETLTDNQIQQRFALKRDSVLRAMHADEGALYGG